MTSEILFVLMTLAVTVLLFVTEKLRVDVVALLVMVVLVAFRILTPSEGIAGFANQATITVGAMLILSEGLQRTGAVNTLGKRLVRLAGKSEARLSLGIMSTVAIISAFINNTAAVAVFLPLTINISREMKFSRSRLLMPLSFAAMFGGLCTLIGTSTNILVSAISEERGLGAFSMFEFLPFGVICTVVGIAYMMTVGRALIPEREPKKSLEERYKLREYITEVIILPDSPLVGKTVKEAQSTLELNIIDLIRDDLDIPLPAPTRKLLAGDILLVSGNVPTLLNAIKRKGWKLLPEFALGDLPLNENSYTLAEAIVAPHSQLIGQTLRSSAFRRRYGAVVLGMQHHGRLVRHNLANLPLDAGDVLLLYGEEVDIKALHQNKDFLLLLELPRVRIRTTKALVALLIVAGVVLLAGLELMSIVVAAILGSLLMVFAGILSLEDAYKALDAQVLVMLGGILSLGAAMEKSGTASYLANLAVDGAGPYGPIALLSIFYLMITLLTSMMSNNATAALFAPIAISVAQGLEVSPKPFLMAVAFAASASFITPIGYQTNTMIYGPGRYRFFDFTRVGTPLTILFWLLATLFIPLFWPF
jgi:di/tricarboxylate transporter